MPINTSRRSLLLLIPILLCTLMELNVLNVAQRIKSDLLDFTIPWLFAMAICYTLPTTKKIWLFIGTTFSFIITLNFLEFLQPEYEKAALSAAVLAPLTSSLLMPKYHSDKRLIQATINYSIAFVFLIMLSLLFGFLSSFIYENVQKLIHTAYFTHVYNDNFSFVYGIIYQFCQTFGFGDFIVNIRQINNASTITQSFYITSIALNICAIPAFYFALGGTNIKQKKHHYYLAFGLLAFLSATSGYSVSLCLILLLWINPSLFGLYLIISIFFYIVGGQIDFETYVSYELFYQPNLDIFTINVINLKFIWYCVTIFVVNFALARFLIIHTMKYKASLYDDTQQIKPVEIDFISDDSEDQSLLTISVIKIVGGYNNILNILEVDNTIKFTLVDSRKIQFSRLKFIGAKNAKNVPNENTLEFSLEHNTDKVYTQIVEFAERQMLDITTTYKENKVYSIENSAFFAQFTTRGVNTNAMDSN